MWGACVYPEQYLLLWYILTPLLLHTKRTIQALYEVSIPYDPNAPLAGALLSSPDSHMYTSQTSYRTTTATATASIVRCAMLPRMGSVL